MGKQQPTNEPKGRARLQGLHTQLAKDGYDIPADYQTFEDKILEQPDRLKSLHDQLVEDKYDIPADYTSFESKALEGLKEVSFLVRFWRALFG